MNKQRRHFAGAEKVTILKRHLLDKVPISDLCDELGLYPNQVYGWLKIRARFTVTRRSFP
jgi:transposase